MVEDWCGLWIMGQERLLQVKTKNGCCRCGIDQDAGRGKGLLGSVCMVEDMNG